MHFRSHNWPSSHRGYDAGQLSDLHQQHGESAASPSGAAGCDWRRPGLPQWNGTSASPPSPCQSNPGTESCRESRKPQEGHAKSTNSYPGEKGWISVLSLGVHTLFRPLIGLILSFRKTPPNPKSPNSAHMKERDSPVFKHKRVWGSLGPATLAAWLRSISHENSARTGLQFTPNWSKCQSLTSNLCHLKLLGTPVVQYFILWWPDGLIFEETFEWKNFPPHKHSNKCTIKLSPWHWESPWSWKPRWMPVFLMVLLSVHEVLQQKKDAAVYCIWFTRCSPKSTVFNLTPGEILWRTPWFLVGQIGWKSTKKCLHFRHKKVQTLRCLGNLALALQSRNTRCMKDLSTANSNLMLRFCLISMYMYRYSFGPEALSPPAEAGAELLTYKYSLLFQFCFWWMLDRYRTAFFESHSKVSSDAFLFRKI